MLLRMVVTICIAGLVVSPTVAQVPAPTAPLDSGRLVRLRLDDRT